MIRTLTPLAVAVLVLLPVLAKPAAKPETPRQTVLRLTNEFRKSEDLPALEENDLLDRAAQKHAENMARQGKLEHVLDDKNPGDRIQETGYQPATWAENIHVSYRDRNPARTAVTWWKKSPGHRKNMLGKQFTQIGIGAARGKSGSWYFCQVFGRPR